MNTRKNINILSLFTVFALAFVVVAMPVKTHANDLERILDPLCIFTCDRNSNKTRTIVRVVNTNTNTNTVTVPAQTPASTVVVNHPTYHSNPPYQDHNYNSLYASCYPTSTSGDRGETIRWRTSVSGGNGDYHITWSGSDGLSGYGTSINKVYNSSGSKYASVHVKSGDQSISRNCTNNVIINDYNNNYDYDSYDNDNDYDYNDRNLSVSCTANTAFAPVGTTVTWTAYAQGGNGRYSYTWDGTDYLSGGGRSISTVYNAPGPKMARVSVRSNGREISQTCTNPVTVGVPVQYKSAYPTYNPPVAAPIVKKPVVQKEIEKDNPLSAASYFSLSNVPWGWVAILIILILLSMVIYLMYNKKKI